MKFFIVTPTLNSLRWLPGCMASVRTQISDDALNVKTVETPDRSLSESPALPCKYLNGLTDREAITVHHHIQDGGSSDGTVQFLKDYVARQPFPDNYQLTFASETDQGMYDAINKGWSRADLSVDWLGQLNSDEQYQPNVFQRMAQVGQAHPSWGAITGNCIWVDEQGRYLCSRKPTLGWPWVGRIWIPAYTCALFIRRKFYGQPGVQLDASWKSLGDNVFCRDLLNAGCRFGYQDEYFSVFIHRGTENLGFQTISTIEAKRYWDETLTAKERRYAPLSIFTAKASRVLRSTLGSQCRSYVWIPSSGTPQRVNVGRSSWRLSSTVPS